jgi:hypothetical protein
LPRVDFRSPIRPETSRLWKDQNPVVTGFPSKAHAGCHESLLSGTTSPLAGLL